MAILNEESAAVKGGDIEGREMSDGEGRPGGVGLGEEGESKTGGRDGRKRIRNKGLGKGTKDEMVTGKEE